MMTVSWTLWQKLGTLHKECSPLLSTHTVTVMLGEVWTDSLTSKHKVTSRYGECQGRSLQLDMADVCLKQGWGVMG